MIEIRSGRKKDVSTILSFHKKLNEYYTSINEKHLIAEPTEVELKHNIGRYLVAVEDEKTIGCIKLTFNRNSVTFSTFYIEPEYRSKGIGKMLMNKAIETGKALNCNTGRLIVKTNNVIAQQMYEKIGFETGGYVMYLDL